MNVKQEIEAIRDIHKDAHNVFRKFIQISITAAKLSRELDEKIDRLPTTKEERTLHSAQQHMVEHYIRIINHYCEQAYGENGELEFERKNWVKEFTES